MNCAHLPMYRPLRGALSENDAHKINRDAQKWQGSETSGLEGTLAGVDNLQPLFSAFLTFDRVAKEAGTNSGGRGEELMDENETTLIQHVTLPFF